MLLESGCEGESTKESVNARRCEQGVRGNYRLTLTARQAGFRKFSP